MSTPVERKAKPIAYFFRELGAREDSAAALLAQLGFACIPFSDPRLLLTTIRRARPLVCVIDFTSPKTQVADALLRALHSGFDGGMPLIALVPAGARELAAALRKTVNCPLVERPILTEELARALSTHAVTDGLAQALATAGPKAFAVPPDLVVPPAVEEVFEKLATPIIDCSAQLEFFEDAEKQLKFYAEQLKPFEEQVVAYVQKLRRKQEKWDLVQSLRALGVANARNLVATRALVNATVEDGFEFDPKTGAPSHDAKVIIPYATKTVEHFGGEGSAYYMIAFTAGLVFDLLVRRAGDLGERKRPVLTFLEARYKDAIRRIDKGLKLGKVATDLAQARHILTAMLMREAGRVAMAMFFEDYLGVQKWFDKKTVSLPLQVLAEEEHYQVAHNVMAAILCQSARELREAMPAVLFCDIPVSLRAKHEHHSKALATFCRDL